MNNLFKISVTVMSQSFFTLPISVRQNATHGFIMKMLNEKNSKIYDEIICLIKI